VSWSGTGAPGSPRYSPDGRRIVIDLRAKDTTDIWILELATGTSRRMTFDGSVNARPVWSTRGDRIVFASNREGGRRELWAQAVDGSGPAVRLAALPRTSIVGGELSPDERWVVFAAMDGPPETQRLWYRSLVGDTTIRRLTGSRFYESSGTFSPDGKWLAYTSEESGVRQVYVRPFPGDGAPVPVSINGGRVPQWSRDGRTIYFAEGTSIHSARLELAGNRPVVTSRASFVSNLQLGAAPSFAVSPDDRWVLALVPELSREREEIHVIYNWKVQLASQLARTAK
jgi:Tol biopolymer transport system component